MNKEGELINQIICQATFRHTPHGDEEIIYLEGIKQIIYEAKKEFPQWDNFKNASFNTTQYQLAVEKWRVKWLGDNP